MDIYILNTDWGPIASVTKHGNDCWLDVIPMTGWEVEMINAFKRHWPSMYQSTSSCSYCDVTDPDSVSEGLSPKSCGHSLTNKTEQPSQHKGEHAHTAGIEIAPQLAISPVKKQFTPCEAVKIFHT